MEFGILGPIEARRADGGPFPIGGPQVRALLAVLALDAGRVVGRERLIDDLYGSEPPGDAGHALQSQVSRLRRALRTGVGDGEFVESAGAGYRLAVDPESVDALRFARLAAQGRKALRDRDSGAAMTLLDEALGLWRGPALADVRDAPFAESQGARLDEARLAAEEDRAEAALAVGDPQAVVATLSELVAAHPLRERARALLMRALYAAGRQAEALETFEAGRRLLADELGADPSAELMDAHLAILRADEVAAVSNRRLPTPLTSFVGREDELARLVPLVAQARLVTLIGPGGTGKTRLALAAGGRVRGDVCFVELAPLVDGVQAAQAIASALGCRDLSAHAAPAPRDFESQLVAMLADRPLLLILDNCEHVVLDIARLAHRLLVACPGLRILATSREALRVTGETLFPVPQLPMAPPDSPLADQLAAPAVRLFADRAAAVRPGFLPDAGTIDLVARICRRLDGLPLAIELAAARLRTLDLPEIDARLTDRFRLLARGDRTAEPRHQTLQAVVAWSWELLDPAEQQLAQRFSVFAGGATTEQARRVCDIDDVDDLLADLTDKSLLDIAAGRYRMLETIREFARTRAIESGDHEKTQRAHAEYFADTAETTDPLLRTDTQLQHLARLTTDHDNLQSALHWSATADPALAARLIAAQAWYWWLTGHSGDGPALANRLLPELNSAVRRPAAAARPHDQPVRRDDVGDRRDADLHEATTLITPTAAPRSDARPPGEERRVPFVAETAAGHDAPGVGSSVAAEARISRPEWLVAVDAEQYALVVAVAARGRDDLAAEVERAAAGVAAQEHPMRQPHLIFLLALAGGLLPGEPAELRRLFGADDWSQAFLRLGDGMALFMSGQVDESEPEFAAALAGFRRIGDRWAIAAALDKLAAVAERRGDRAASLALIDEAIAVNTELGWAADTADLLTRRGDIHLGGAAERDAEAARADYERAAELSRTHGAIDMYAGALRGLGDIARAEDPAAARNLYRSVLEIPAGGSIAITEAHERAREGLALLNDA
ncbi:BTAD domain-containing putative transcriptional regulator [Nocardia sp. NPDC059239]|uniref:BTAD domain-containing putative transcriptional regulator n=1 Tax=unclassified Nocardia TaxID=2637762 RepID=UPI0036816E73